MLSGPGQFAENETNEVSVEQTTKMAVSSVIFLNQN